MPSSKNNLSLGLRTVSQVADSIQLSLNGTIPSYLSNKTLYRVGPGRFDVDHSDAKPFRIDHWFDGLSLLHAFTIGPDAATVSYRNRFLVDDLVGAIEKTPRSKWTDFSFASSPDPCRSLLGRFFQMLVPSDQADYSPNIGVTLEHIPGKGLTIRSDMAYQKTLNETTLEVDQFFGLSHLTSTLKGVMSAAHGHYDANTGEYFNYCYDLSGPGNTDFKVFKVGPDGKTHILATINAKPAYIHSFATTDNYVVLIVWPYYVNSLKVLWSRNLANGLHFHEDLPTTFYVVSRHGDGVVKKLTSDAFFCFHTINAFEQPSTSGESDEVDIVIDLVKFNNADVVNELYLDKLKSLNEFSPSTISRFVLQHENGKVHERVISDSSIELPRMDPRLERRDYTFAYGVSNEKGPLSSISKVNVKSGEQTLWYEQDKIVGEPIFVPDPNGQAEDDGCVLLVALDCASKTSSLVVLDAKDMTEIAGAQVPQIVPLGFHGAVLDS